MTDEEAQLAALQRIAEATSPIREELIPPLCREGLDRYAAQGIPVGSFLEAVLCNDLMQAVKCADRDSQRGLCAIVAYVYGKLPWDCHGSVARYHAWIHAHAERRAKEKADREKAAKAEEPTQ